MRLAVHPSPAQRCQRVTPIPGLGQCVGPEGNTHPEIDEFPDHGLVLPLLEVVHELRALVTDVTRMLEPNRPFHMAVKVAARVADVTPLRVRGHSKPAI